MGSCSSCCQEESSGYEAIDQETRRQQAAAAAEQRMKANESRGIKDPEALKRRQQQREDLEKKAIKEQPKGGEGLRWQVG